MKENDQAHYLKITQSFSGSVNGEQTTDISECLGTIPLYKWMASVILLNPCQSQ